MGSNRWIGSEGIVLQEIDPLTGDGLVKVLNEEWRATAPENISAGVRTVVREVKGTRVVVEPLED